MTPDQLFLLIQALLGQYGWWIIATAAVFFFKSTIENCVSGLSFLYGSDYNVDDEVFIGGTKRARIVRQTITKTVFYVYETNRRLVVPNKQLYSLRIEKVLPSEGDRPCTGSQS